ncbi:MAG: phosphotransferase [Pseudomonadota bacterium]
MISMICCEQLTQALFPGAGVRAATPLAGGVSATVALLEVLLPDRTVHRVVVRQHAAEHDGLDAAVEAQLLKTLHAGGLRVPAVLLVDADARLLERPGLVLEHIPGTSEVSAAALPAAIETMVDVLLKIHRFSSSALPALPQRLDPVPELLGFLPPDDRFAALRRWLGDQRDTAYRGPAKLLHGDFWPENLLWREGELVAVLDWEDAALGDPVSDLAGAGVELRVRHGRAVMQRYLESVTQRYPIDPSRLTLWQAYVAAAMLKYMGSWDLPPAQEARMRVEAGAMLHEASAALLDGT